MYKKIVFIILLLAALTEGVKGEGTRELQPLSANGINLRVNYDTDPNSTDGGPFATSSAPNDSYRLWVSVATSSEKILFGFQKNSSTQTIGLTIFNANHVQVYPATGSLALPNAGAGYIGSYAQAVAGPVTINSAGYTPLEFTPGAAGDYYFEFSWSPASSYRYIKFYDITVVNASNAEKRGRLWSKNWQMETPASNIGFYGVMYPYTDDQITTVVNFNGMAPGRFTVSCNPTGCSNSGNFITDRMSVTGNHTYPAYKIFINNPDENLFPTGIVGGVDSVHVHNPCNGTVDIDLYVNKQGTAEILLDINPLPGIQAEDVVLNDTVYSGNATTLHWNGLNGLGVAVPSGTSFNIVTTYVNGLTHLPLYDVEHSSGWNGFVVDLVRPAGNKPNVYWDDRNLTGGGFNLDGCTTATGCHSWGNMGNNNSVNTWWFAVSITLAPVAIQYRRSETIAMSLSICQYDSANVFGIWRKESAVYRDTATNVMGCDSITELTLLVKPVPVIELGSDLLLCQGESATLGYSIPGVTTYLWNTVPPQVFPIANSSTILVNSTATYKVVVTASNGCSRSDQVHVTAASYIGQKKIQHN